MALSIISSPSRKGKIQHFGRWQTFCRLPFVLSTNLVAILPLRKQIHNVQNQRATELCRLLYQENPRHQIC